MIQISKLEKFYLQKVVDLFRSFPLTTHLPNFDTGAKGYGQNAETMHKGAKNPILGAIGRIWTETPTCIEKNIIAAPAFLGICADNYIFGP